MTRVYIMEPRPPAATRRPIATDTVPLAWAGLCMDCEDVRDVRLAECPRCASAAVLPLARVLGREAA